MTKSEILCLIENKIFKRHETEPSQAFINDFNWIVESGETNAHYGYGPSILLEVNTTAIQIASFGEYARRYVLKAGRIGHAKASEDKEYLARTWKKLEDFAKEDVA